MACKNALKKVLISGLRRDPEIQPRVHLDPALIDEYAEAMKAGAEFPPLLP